MHEKNIFNCTKCNRGFTRKDERNKHEGKCKNKFSKKDMLNKHLLTHTGEKLFTGTMCPRKFSGLKPKIGILKIKVVIRSWNLKKHRKDRICPSVFPQVARSSLLHHMRVVYEKLKQNKV